MSSIQTNIESWDGHDLSEVEEHIKSRLNTEAFYFANGTSSHAGVSTSGKYLSTKWEASVPGITSAFDGLKLAYRINTNTGVSTGGVVLSVDNENYYPVVMNKNSIVTTNYPVGATILVVFNSTQTATAYLTSNTQTTVTGCWQIMEYNTNTDTIGYSIRTNKSTRPLTDKTVRYRILFSSKDDCHWVPANTSTSTNATSARAVNQTPINPFGEIVYYGTTSALEANASPSTSYQWQQYDVTLGYSFNTTGAALTLTFPGSVYVKCTPQSDGSAIIDSTTPIVQSLPNTEDGKIYIYLGRAYSATAIELINHHPVYYYKNGGVRLWTGE